MSTRTILGNLINQASNTQLPNNFKSSKRPASSEPSRKEKKSKCETKEAYFKSADVKVEECPFINVGVSEDNSIEAVHQVEELYFVDIEHLGNDSKLTLPGVIDIDSIHGDDKHFWSEYAR